ncbi:hypothetical protein L1887_34932 [Cichorium endivia]|nr:hypothetical protein L1887_34932 [Cichorium endivia]
MEVVLRLSMGAEHDKKQRRQGVVPVLVDTLLDCTEKRIFEMVIMVLDQSINLVFVSSRKHVFNEEILAASEQMGEKSRLWRTAEQFGKEATRAWINQVDVDG